MINSRARGPQRSMTEEQKVVRRERNREHAKRSRVRKKFLLESLQQSVNVLRGENEKLRSAIREHVADDAEKLLASCRLETHGLLTNANKQAVFFEYKYVQTIRISSFAFTTEYPKLSSGIYKRLSF